MLSRTLVRRLPVSKATLVRALSSHPPNTQNSNTTGRNQNSYWLGALSALGASMAIGASMTLTEAPQFSQPDAMIPVETPTSIKDHPTVNSPPARPDLPVFTREEVSEHSDEDSLWYTFRGGVYDLTTFYQGHPGGAPRLLMAAGQDLEPYWEIYRQHLRGHVVDWMEKHRIGSLSKEEAEAASKSFEFGDAYETDPERDANLLPCTQKPFNGEPRIDLLTRDYITPNELFYVRNHLPVPDIEAKEYRLIVKGKGLKKHKFTLEDLKTKFKKHEIITTLQCAGNRREDLHNDQMREFLAPHWVVGAISTAKWGGVRIRDVLKECGLDVDAMALGELEIPGLEHIQFEAYDQDETGVHYGGSVPVMKAIDPFGDAIFAFEMNGEPLPRDHGYPCRVILPGHAGCRQCKWVHKMILSDKESNKCWQQKSYRHFAPDINFEKDLATWPPERLDQAPISQMMPVQSIICNPPQNTILGGKNADSVTVKGVAWSGGGREIQRVDVSIDGGKNWTAAELYKPIKQRWNHHWAWTQFYQTVKLPEEIQKKLKNGEKVSLDLCSKALNSDFNVQPERMEPYWNARGIGINHWYHVNTTLDPNANPGTIQRDGSTVEFGGNTPTGGKFAEKWDMHGWSADPEHRGPSGLKTKPKSFYDKMDDDRKARIQKEVEKCTPSDE
ncbi:unnamed protein product [Cylindrotheca closterium]|uniref:sulfite oxidase n=1 Tax=Cylindrotheca closterium TaxID=2856 RepID=A0AAD2FLZ4_9STRA|nr:unnamed protein product [Cylindrotheca closterium]